MSYPAWPDLSVDQLEQRQLELWKSEKLFQQTLESADEGQRFVFYEGPPTANGRPGIHHVFARTIKDLICRYQAMQGKAVTRIAGWDTHGLPVEIEVEKELQLSGKKDIETFGVAEFNARARKSVFKYQSEWEQLSARFAYWLDYDHPYVTYSNDYIETVWWLLRRLHERDLLYRGHRVLPYCPRCGTVLSSHELALGYEDVTNLSVYVTLPLEDDPSRQLLIWTTMPWTVVANVAVVVHPDIEYGEYRVGDRTIILATARAAALASSSAKGAPTFAELGAIRTFPGRELIGLRYQRALDVIKLSPEQRSRVVIPGDYVTADDGSGLVGIAPAFGSDDYQSGIEHGLVMARPVAADGTFVGTSWPELEGRLVTARETNELVIQRLKQVGRWHLTEAYTHAYPHCWRCSSALMYYARDSWFVRTTAVKERMLEINRQIGWHPPEVGAGRFGGWLENNVDWALSRDRYWGTPLPVWVCDRDDAHVEVIGSYTHLSERWGKPLAENFDPHKPYIDEYTWTCNRRGCEGTMRRTPEVIDTWFDSGAMPYAQWHYPFENQKEFETHFPADYICEGVDQTRGWFYSLMAIATTAFDSPAYRNVIVNELVLDAEGQKMSKSRGNVVDPWDVIGEFGADTVRVYLLASSQVWLPKRFDRRTIPDVAGGFLQYLKSTYEFFRLYADSTVLAAAPPVADRPLVDRWMLARLDATVAAVRAAWDDYDVTSGLRAIMDFVVNDVSRWYVRQTRARFWAPDSSADAAAVATLHEVLVSIVRLLAPAAPFASDWIHRALAGTSVHLARFPTVQNRRDEPLEAAMDAVRRLASLAHAARQQRKLGVRQPLARMQVAVPGAVRGPAFDELLELLKLEVNVKTIEVVASDTSLVRLRPKPNFRSLGKRYGKRTAAVAAAAAGLVTDQLRALERGDETTLVVDGEPTTYLPEDVVVEREVTSDWLVQSDGPYVVALDPDLTLELRREGLAREVVNRVQRIRKEAGYVYTDRIALWISGDGEVLDAVRAHEEFIQGETLARKVAVGSRAPAHDVEQEVDIDGLAVVMGVQRSHDGRDGAGPQG